MSKPVAERIHLASQVTVEQAVQRLHQAVEASGAQIFSTVDFRVVAASQGERLRPTTIVIFGGPKIASNAVQICQTMALHLPLRILFFEDENGQAWATYDDPTAIAPWHGLAADNPAILAMKNTLQSFSAISTGN